MPVNRTKTGQFQKGCSGNPSGRPKLDPEIVKTIRSACPHAVERLIEFVDDKNPKIAMWAITELLDRGYGKPTQVQSVSMDLSGGLDLRAHVRDSLLEYFNGKSGINGTDSE